jgi:hypothetical protein
VNVFAPQDMQDVARDISNDQIAFNGKTYDCLSKTPWAAIDGWIQILCVQVN